MNWASRCSACKTCDEQHEKRHREIAEILNKIRRLERDQEISTAPSRNTTTPPNAQEQAKATVMFSKKDRKMMRKAIKAIDREKVITAADIARVAEVLHSEADELDEQLQDLELKLNLSFHASTCNTKSARFGFPEKDSETGDADLDKCEMKRILGEFGVAANAEGALGCLVADLVEAILHDLDCHRGEMKTFARNRAGFWRWATSKALSHQIEHGKAWDDKAGIPLVEQTKNLPQEGARESSVCEPAEQPVDETVLKPSSFKSSVRIHSMATSVNENEIKRRLATTAAQVPSNTRLTPFNAWTTPLPIRRGEKAPPTGRTVKLSANNGLHHLKVKTHPRTLYDYSTYRNDYSSGEEYVYCDSDD
jgi:hypothetical protein